MGHLAGHTSAAGGQGCSRIADRLPTRLVLCGPYTDYVYPLFPENRKLRYFLGADCNAKKYFYIQTPYFLPTEAVLVAMQTAALSGVDVRLMLPMRADNRLTHLGSCSYLADVLYSGVKVYFYKKGFLHITLR